MDGFMVLSELKNKSKEGRVRSHVLKILEQAIMVSSEREEGNGRR